MKQDNEIMPLKLDLGYKRKHSLDESFLRMFGGTIKMILQAIFGGYSLPVNITGNKYEIESFANTLSKEKKYMETFKKYGLNDPRVIKDKSKLNNAVQNFERITGIKYPLK